MFAKIFTQILDSSIARSPDTRRMFQDMLILADPTGAVDMTPDAIARRLNLQLEEVQREIVELMKPDPASRSRKEDGRRLVPLDPNRDWGWQIVNYDHYRKIRDQEALRSYYRDYKRALRSKVKRKSVQDRNRTSLDASGIPSSTSSSESSPKVKRGLDSVDGFEVEWDAFKESRRKMGHALTARASELIRAKLDQRPSDAVAALRLAVERGWRGIEWDWFDKERKTVPSSKRSQTALTAAQLAAIPVQEG